MFFSGKACALYKIQNTGRMVVKALAGLEDVISVYMTECWVGANLLATDPFHIGKPQHVHGYANKRNPDQL